MTHGLSSKPSEPAKTKAPTSVIRAGDSVTIALTRGAAKVTTVARAMENGSLGQTIRVQNDATREIYRVVLTGTHDAIVIAQSAADPKDTASSAGVASVAGE